MKIWMKKLSLISVCLMLFTACDGNVKKREAQRQKKLEELMMQICGEQPAEIVIEKSNIQIQCSENNRTYDMVDQGNGYDIIYKSSLPESTLMYSKYGERIQATVRGEWIVDSKLPNVVDVYFHVVAGSKQDQEFDMIIDLRNQIIYRTDPITKQRGSELEFIASLQEALFSHASDAIINASKPLLERYGSLYQIQNLLMNKETILLREDAYYLPFSIPQILYMQFPVSDENGLLFEKQNNYFQFDLKNKRVIANTCNNNECDYQLTQYDLNQNAVIYYPGTSKEVVIEPDTCTTEKFCEVSKTIKTSFISTLAFQSRLAPFRQSVDYNAQFTRGNIEELNKYLAGIMKRYYE